MYIIHEEKNAMQDGKKNQKDKKAKYTCLNT